MNDKKQKNMKKVKRNIKISIEKLFRVFILIFFVVLLFSIFQVSQLQKELNEEMEMERLEKIPAELQVTKLVNSECEECFDIDAILTKIKGNNVNITYEETVEFDTVKGRGIITKYGLEKVPAVIVTGETDRTEKLEKSLSSFLKEKDGALLFTEPKPPYTDASNGDIVGLVSVTYLKENTCTRCNNLSQIIPGLKSETGMVVGDESTVWVSSKAGQSLIEKYNITTAPSIILSADAGEYKQVRQEWPAVGSIEDDGVFVLRLMNPLFFDIATAEVKGFVDVTYITDKSCDECYNISIHQSILANPAGYNLQINEETFVDLADDGAQELLDKYTIAAVPTFILIGDMQYYDALSSVWPQVGTVEEDGTYIFRNIDIMRVIYKNLETGELVNPAEVTG